MIRGDATDLVRLNRRVSIVEYNIYIYIYDIYIYIYIYVHKIVIS